MYVLYNVNRYAVQTVPVHCWVIVWIKVSFLANKNNSCSESPATAAAAAEVLSHPRQLRTKAASCLSTAGGSSSSGSGQLTSLNSHRLFQPVVSSEDRPLVDSRGFRKTKDSCDSHAAVKCEAVGRLSLNIVEEDDRKNSRPSCQFGPGSSDTAPPNNTRLFITEESDRLRKAVDNRQIAAESRQIAAENRRTAEHFRPKATEKKDAVQLHFRRGAELKYLFT
jgi:hypothetical protein